MADLFKDGKENLLSQINEVLEANPYFYRNDSAEKTWMALNLTL